MKKIFFLFFLFETSFSQTEKISTQLTIYNDNFALIHEERNVNLNEGINKIIIDEIPSTIDGTSLYFESKTAKDKVKILEQNFHFDLVHQGKLLEKYLNKEVEFVRFDETTKKEISFFGKLLSTGFTLSGIDYHNNGNMIAEINGKIEIAPIGRLLLPSLPEGLITKPQLEWMLENSLKGKHNVEMSYLAKGISWNANYVARLSEDDKKIDLIGWVTISNSCGTSFQNANLKLVAGDVNIVKEKMQYDRNMTLGIETFGASSQFEQKEFFEYKLYSLQRKTNLNNNETKQIEFISSNEIPVKKSFIYDGTRREKVGVFVNFKNDEKSKLGIALPKGIVRVYKKDDEEKEQFIGEDEISHTSKDEEIKLYLGNAFDIVGQRVRKNVEEVRRREFSETIEITLKNHKKEDIEILVYEHPNEFSKWQILESNEKWEKISNGEIKFTLKIPKDGEKTILYTIEYEY